MAHSMFHLQGPAPFAAHMSWTLKSEPEPLDQKAPIGAKSESDLLSEFRTPARQATDSELYQLEAHRASLPNSARSF